MKLLHPSLPIPGPDDPPPADPGDGAPPAAPPASPPPPPPPPADPAAPEPKPAAYKPEDVELWKASHEKLAAQAAKAPLNAGDYSLEVDGSITWGAGEDGKPVPFAIDPESPLATEGREWAKKHGLSADAFAEARNLFAKAVIDMVSRAEEKQIKDGEAAMARLAPPDVPEADRIRVGLDRAERLETYLKDHKLDALAGQIRTPEAIVALEVLIEKAGGPRSGPAPTTGQSSVDWTKLSGKDLRAQAWRERKSA